MRGNHEFFLVFISVSSHVLEFPLFFSTETKKSMLNANMEVSKSRKMRTFNNIRFMEVLSMIRYMGMPMPTCDLYFIHQCLATCWNISEYFIHTFGCGIASKQFLLLPTCYIEEHIWCDVLDDKRLCNFNCMITQFKAYLTIRHYDSSATSNTV